MNESLWDLLSRSLLPIVGGAITGTIPLALVSFALGLLIALAVALMRLSRVKEIGRAHV